MFHALCHKCVCMCLFCTVCVYICVPVCLHPLKLRMFLWIEVVCHGRVCCRRCSGPRGGFQADLATLECVASSFPAFSCRPTEHHTSTHTPLSTNPGSDHTPRGLKCADAHPNNTNESSSTHMQTHKLSQTKNGTFYTLCGETAGSSLVAS